MLYQKEAGLERSEQQYSRDSGVRTEIRETHVVEELREHIHHHPLVNGVESCSNVHFHKV